MFLAGTGMPGNIPGDVSDAFQSDPEARQARLIAEAARRRLLACLAGPQDVIDLTQAQRMLDAVRDARALAEDAEDRVLVHHGLLSLAEADRRAAARRPEGAPSRPGARAFPLGAAVGPGEARAVLLVAAALAGAALARRLLRR